MTVKVYRKHESSECNETDNIGSMGNCCFPIPCNCPPQSVRELRACDLGVLGLTCGILPVGGNNMTTVGGDEVL